MDTVLDMFLTIKTCILGLLGRYALTYTTANARGSTRLWHCISAEGTLLVTLHITVLTPVTVLFFVFYL